MRGGAWVGYMILDGLLRVAPDLYLTVISICPSFTYLDGCLHATSTLQPCPDILYIYDIVINSELYNIFSVRHSTGWFAETRPGAGILICNKEH